MAMTTLPPTTNGTLTTSTTTSSTSTRTRRRSGLWSAGAMAGIGAAAATTLIAVVARAADISLAVQGERIPLAAFAQLTLVGALIGLVLAKATARWTGQPRRTFVTVTLALTALSLLPDVLADAATATKLALTLTHVVAASIVIPSLAVRLER
jgi:hypothetical protein